MALFDTLFWIVLLVSALGGLINTVIRSVRSVDDGNFNRSQAIAWFIRDILAGIGAGFAAWLFSQAMNNDAGVLFLAFLAALAGVAALDQFLRTQGYKNERDLLKQSIVEENDILEPLKTRLEKSEKERLILQQRLSDALAKLQIATEREQFHNEIEDLQERLSQAEAKLSEVSQVQDAPQDDEDNDQQQSNPAKQ